MVRRRVAHPAAVVGGFVCFLGFLVWVLGVRFGPRVVWWGGTLFCVGVPCSVLGARVVLGVVCV